MRRDLVHIERERRDFESKLSEQNENQLKISWLDFDNISTLKELGNNFIN